ncbi:MAG: acyltransferase [Thalassolituus sp.]|uniref:acyltransferase family protein n=1 Tax=Thalassolituus sp. TaxID=2030822 RepID=UPI003981A1DA
MYKNLVFGSTALFVFISGYLFHSIFYEKFNYFNFLTNKTKNVLVPYVLLSILPILYILIKGQPVEYFHPSQSILGGFRLTLEYLLTGRSLVAYWYIPFAMLIFLTSPLHIKFIKSNMCVQIFIISLFLLLAFFVHRPPGNLNVFQSYIYYTPLYLLGIVFSLYKSDLDVFFEDKIWIFLLLLSVILFGAFQYFYGEIGSYRRFMFDGYHGVDFQLLQKISMCIFIFYMLKAIELPKIFDVLAKYSFAIFFLHPYFLYLIGIVDSKFNYSQTLSIPIYLFSVLLCLSFCILVSKIIKSIFKKNSRYLIGY